MFLKENINICIRTIGVFLLVTMLFLSFYKNSFNVAINNQFENFQSDSEGLVLGKAFLDKIGKRTGNANLAYIENDPLCRYPTLKKEGGHKEYHPADITDKNWTHGFSNFQNTVVFPRNYDLYVFVKGNLMYEDQVREIESVISDANYIHVSYSGSRLTSPVGPTTVTLVLPGQSLLASQPYLSSYGLQGLVFSFAENYFKLSKNALHKTTSLILAVVIMILTLQLCHIVNIPFGISFFISVFLSPWITSFARNLYWCTFSWFLPAVMAFLLFLPLSRKKKLLTYMGFGLCMLFKMLMGYEYLSSIVLFSFAPFIYKFLTSNSQEEKIKYLKIIAILSLIVLASFGVALLIHAKALFGSYFDGLVNIFRIAMKRTYGEAKDFSEVYIASLNASYGEVLKLYFKEWQTDVITFLPGRYFLLSICASLVGGLLLIRIKAFSKALILLLIYSLVPLSWFILAKPHSYIHTHMNYVLFYLGFISCIFYVFLLLIKFLLMQCKIR